MEIKRLTKENYDELLGFLNYVFANKYKREMDFLNEQPKMWVRDDEHMGKHFGVFENGKLVSVAGLYPLNVKIGENTLLFATTGNVATHPEYEGRGYFRAIFTEIMKELKKLNVDVARLGGDRQRYANWGYEPAGQSYNILFTENNRIKFFKNIGDDIKFKKIERNDIDSLKFVNELSRKSKIFVERSIEDNYRDVYGAICTRHTTPYLAIKHSNPVGYLSAVANNQHVGSSDWGSNILEIRANDAEIFTEMICAWQRELDTDITFKLPPHMPELLKKFLAGAENITISSPSRFKVMNFEKLINALMRIKNPAMMIDGEVVVEILDYGKIKLFKKGDACGCELCGEDTDIVFDNLTAIRILLGHTPPIEIAETSPLLASWLPLPLSWDMLDTV